jgi:hypothetical protein
MAADTAETAVAHNHLRPPPSSLPAPVRIGQGAGSGPATRQNRKSPAFARPLNCGVKLLPYRWGGHSCPPSFLSLGELEAPPRAALPVFLYVPSFANRASENPAFRSGAFDGRIIFHQRPPQSHDDRPGLSGRPAARAVGPDVQLATRIGHFQWPKDRLAIALIGKMLVERAAVDLDLPSSPAPPAPAPPPSCAGPSPTHNSASPSVLPAPPSSLSLFPP